jgi:hypothetical protein
MAKTYLPTSVRKTQNLYAYLAKYQAQLNSNIKESCKDELAALIAAAAAFIVCAYGYIKPDEEQP